MRWERNMALSLAPHRHRLLGNLATVQAALEILDRRTSLSTDQRDLVDAALRAAYELAAGLREASVSAMDPAADRPLASASHLL